MNESVVCFNKTMELILGFHIIFTSWNHLHLTFFQPFKDVKAILTPHLRLWFHDFPCQCLVWTRPSGTIWAKRLWDEAYWEAFGEIFAHTKKHRREDFLCTSGWGLVWIWRPESWGHHIMYKELGWGQSPHPDAGCWEKQKEPRSLKKSSSHWVSHPGTALPTVSLLCVFVNISVVSALELELPMKLLLNASHSWIPQDTMCGTSHGTLWLERVEEQNIHRTV